MRSLGAAAALICSCSVAAAQTISQQGLVEARGIWFAEPATNDPTRGIGDLLIREEVTAAPVEWLQLTAGADLRANSHDQVEDEWRLDVEDRSTRRPRLSMRRLTATISRGGFSLDLGKQFIRWARVDILNPMDRFAPRDFLNGVDFEYLPVAAARASIELGSETLEAVWVPRLTPSRMPLLDQRWTVIPREAEGLRIIDEGARFPRRSQYGARWRHVGSRFEAGFSYFEGFNHLPDIEARMRDSTSVGITRTYPRLRSYGAEFAVPTTFFTFKGEGAYFLSPDETFSRYGLYVVEVERQAGEWLLTGGYAGGVETSPEDLFLAFDPERGFARTVLGRAAYTVDPRRTITIEVAVRQNGDGDYIKGDYSQALGQYWRAIVTGALLTGDSEDFLGQFRRNTHVSAGLRFTF